jgi:hypothetical protein
MRRTHMRGHANVLKWLFIHIGGFNLGLLMRTLIGIGTPRGLQGHLTAAVALLVAIWTRVVGRWQDPSRFPADDSTAFTPHHRFELLLVSASEPAA